MPESNFQDVDTACDRIAAEVIAASPSESGVWQIAGEPTAGKTAALEGLAARLRQRQLIPVMVAPPPGSDSGPYAVIQIGTELKRGQVINGKLNELTQPTIPWETKLELLREWMGAEHEKLVILCDEPTTWGFVAKDEPFFAERTDQVVNTILRSVNCRRVVAGAVPGGLAVHREIKLHTSSTPHLWLSNERNWGHLALAARQVLDVYGDEIIDFSRLQVRLLVALAYVLGPMKFAEWRPSVDSKRRVVERLILALLRKRSVYRPLLRTWAELALVRRPFNQRLLDQLTYASLDEPSKELVTRCLLFKRGDRLVLHELLRADLRPADWWPKDGLRRRVHGALARHYREEFASEDEIHGQLLDEMEAYHHATLSDDVALADEFRTFFVEQLDALGRQISLRSRHERPLNVEGLQRAAMIFEKCISWDPKHGYAHHYLAFNLDWAGLEPAKVKQHYCDAIELEPVNVWWRSRLISFLVTRGRTKDAEVAWDQAQDALGLPSADPYVYRNLHVWVAMLLVHRGQLEFAGRVLRGIPKQVINEEPYLRAVNNRLVALMIARQKGAYVPVDLLDVNWWKEGPYLLAATEDGRPLSEWLAGRVDGIEEGILHLRVARLKSGVTKEPAYEGIEVSFSTFDAWSRDEKAEKLNAGRFVEVGKYVAGGSEVIVARVHAERHRSMDPLPQLIPDPVRYLRRSGVVRKG